jgi:hypothetical protein
MPAGGTTNARMNGQSKNDSLACLPAYNMVERRYKIAPSQGAERSSEYTAEYQEGEGVGGGGVPARILRPAAMEIPYI